MSDRDFVEEYDEAHVRMALGDSDFLERVIFLDQVDSTNEFLKRNENALKGNVLVVAQHQTAGKGSKGRSWSSPAGDGVWMSLLIRPDLPMEKAPMLTLVMALSVARACRELCGVSARIKWPNDVVCSGKKLCGILTELVNPGPEGYGVIVGMGINVNTPRFEEELVQRATSLWLETGEHWKRTALIGRILEGFAKDYACFLEHMDLSGLLRSYDALSATIGQRVRVLDVKGEYVGTAVSVGADGSLLVQLEDGSTRRVIGDEVSVRGIYGYA